MAQPPLGLHGMRVHGFKVALTLTLLSMGATEPARAEHRSVRLEYAVSAPSAACPDQAKLEALTSARLGYSPFSDRAEWIARCRVEEARGRLTGRVELARVGQSTGASRTVTSRANECESLVTSMALALAIAIDPQPAPVVAPLPPPPPQVASPPPPPPPAAQEPSSPWRLLLFAGPSVSVGVSPAPALGASVQVELRRAALGLRAAATYLDGGSAQAFGGDIRTTVVRGDLDLCGRLKAIGLCLHGSGGALQAAGSGFANPRRGTLPAFTVGPRVSFELNPVSELVLRAFAGVDVALARSALIIGDTEVWRTPPVSLDTGLSIGWGFP